MVSYFVPRVRFVAKSVNLREPKKKQGWPMLCNFRQTFTTRSSSTSKKNCVNDADIRFNNVVKETSYSQTKLSNLYHALCKRPRNVWVRWTLFLLRLAPVGFCTFGALEWQLHKQKCQREKIQKTASDFQSMVYRSLPLRIISRFWGWMAACYIPIPLRPFLFGWYATIFNVNLEEALYSDFRSYETLSEFFTRPLKNEARIIDPKACLISPADGRVLHIGRATNSLIEQVKGVDYSIESFIGPLTWLENKTEKENYEYSEAIKEVKGGNTELYQCVIYLAPGDYHRFHSPTQWQPVVRRHFSGELLSVSPRIAKWLPGLFCLNERVIYLGKWKYGFFSYTAVGATNVGSVQIYMDDNLKTNRWMGINVGAHKRSDYDELHLKKGIELQKGDPLGQFNMGSTIVLIFEAPKNFQFNIKSGEIIQVGKAIGSVE